MKAKKLCLVLGAALLALPASAATKDIVLPAGTLMTCMMDEPNFSSATVTTGDPFLCHPRAMQMFGHSAFPRGTYVVGHLEDTKDPGHFVGKGWLQLSFDRIGLADNDVPLSAKVIAVKGYRVNREGKIIGHGHATRDAVEWMLPPLWPWKVLTLPARGPRPALKGEVAVTLRLMEDVTIPSENSFSNRLEPGARLILPPPVRSNPVLRVPVSPSPVSPTPVSPSRLLAPSPAPMASTGKLFPMEPPFSGGAMSLAEAAALVTHHSTWRHFGDPEPRTALPMTTLPVTTMAGTALPVTALTGTTLPRTTLFATKPGMVYAAIQYRRNSDTLALVLTSGALVTMDMKDLDWITTTRLNSERGVRVNLQIGVLCNGECAGN